MVGNGERNGETRKVREQRISGYQVLALESNFALNLANIICNTFINISLSIVLWYETKESFFLRFILFLMWSESALPV